MKRFLSTVSVLLLLSMVLGILPAGLLSFAAGAKDKVLFSSSFETDDPAIKESTSDSGYYGNIAKYELSAQVPGEFTELVVTSSIQGSADFKSEESKRMLFDMSSSTKFLTEANKPSQSNPVWVSFELEQARAIGIYVIVSANDEPSRDPKSWRLLASNDGQSYTEIDSRSQQTFSARFQAKTYVPADNKTEYKYFRLEITENNGAATMTQFADLRFGTGIDDVETVGDSPMATVVTAGPTTSYAGTGAFDGKRAVAVYGTQTQKTETYARNIIYSGLDIKVGDNTQLSYVHFPAFYDGSTYDYEYTAMYMMIDVKFTDGKYLSELGAVNQNGFVMDPVSIGDSYSLYSSQWNYLETDLSAVAKGKTIESIYIYFRMDETTEAATFLAYFDDLVIEEKAPVTYEHLSDYIVTTRGTNDSTSFSRGLTAPFCTMPNGFNFYMPVTNVGSNKPYDYYDDEIKQFSISHIPSNWVGDYGTWQFMANTSVDTSDISSVTSGAISSGNIGASFSHDNEIAKAHYYSVTFDEGSKASGVQVEMTPTVHGLYVRFTFPEGSDNVNIIFDCVRADGSLTYGYGGDSKAFSATSQHTQNGSANLRIYGEFSVEPEECRVLNSKMGIASFPEGTEVVTMKLATSFISVGQAEHSLELEIDDTTDFDDVFERAQKAWDDICGIFEIEGATFTELTTFYSCVYRMYSYPNLYSENEGTNESPEWVYASPYKGGRKTDGKLYVNNGFWDTYRTAWAAYALFTPSLDGELLNGLIQHYDDNGWIPRWVAPGGTSSMLGTSSDIIFADAYVKGVEFDYEAAFESMIRNGSTVSNNVTNGGRAENETAIFTGYVTNSTQYGLSWTLEDYISDYCIGVMAEKLGYTDEAAYYYNRAKFYVNMFHPTLKMFVGKNASGQWTNTSYDGVGWWGDYSETNGWTMRFATVYDAFGLAATYGGKARLEKYLDAYFDNSVAAMKRVANGTIHEMIEAREVRLGQYQQSNQPSHAIPYLYAYVDAPYKTQEIVREVLSRLFVGSEIGQGYCGDEDNGEMSAWYVLSAIGIYPYSMGSGQYIIGSPLFDKVTVHLENGNDLVITAKNNSTENIYIQSMTLNGEEYNDCFITHEAISEGAEIVFTMGNKKSEWGTGSSPASLTDGSAEVEPATDIVTGRFRISSTAFNPDKASVRIVYAGGIDGAANLFDDNANTKTTVENGAQIVVSSGDPMALEIYTVSCDMSSKAVSSLKLEGSSDGREWVLLDKRDGLEYDYNKYTRCFAIAEENIGSYSFYRLTIGSSSSASVSEIEFLAHEGSEPAEEPGTPDTEQPGVTENPGEVTTAPDTDNTGTPGENAGTEETGGLSDSAIAVIIVASVLIAAAAATGAVLLVRAKKKK